MKTYRPVFVRKISYVFIRKVLKVTKEVLVIVVLLLTIAMKLKLIG